MIFSKLVLLFLIFKVDCLRANKTASLVIGYSEEVEMENLITEFMTDLEKFSFKRRVHHRFILLGNKTNFLQAAKVMLKSDLPHFISTKAEAVVFPLHFGAADSTVLFFIDGFSDSQMDSIFGKLPSNYKCSVLLISVENKWTEEWTSAIIASAGKMKVKNVSLARFDGHVIKIYRLLLTANCELRNTLINTWTPKNGFRKKTNVIQRLHRARLNAHGCPQVISTFELPPTMMLREDDNEVLHIRGGLEGRLVTSVTKYLNIVPVVKVPSVQDKLCTTHNGTIAGIVGDVAREVANFGIGQIRPTPEREKLVDFTNSYNHECMVWTVPYRTKYNHSVALSEFSPTTWMIVILSVSLCCGLVYTIPRLNMGCSSSLNVFDVIAMTLNYSVPRRPSGTLCKLFFILYLQYSRVLTIAYSTSLSSILTTTTLEPVILNEKEILDAGLRTAGTQSSLDVLAAQIPPNSTRANLINRYEVITSVRAALARITRHQDIAYLRHYSTISNAAKELSMAGEPIKFHTVPGCVISYNSVMVTQKGSRLTHQVNEIILRLREAGIYNHWITLDGTRESRIRTWKPDDRTLVRLRSIFILYLCCLIPALVAFGAELIAFKLQLNWFTC